MSAVMEQELTTLDVLVEQARTWTTPELAALYRTRRDMAQADAEFFGWADTRAAAARVLRERVAADWLHRRWCRMPDECPLTGIHLSRHEDAARRIVAAFEAETPGGLSEAVCCGLWPDHPVSAASARDVAACTAFHTLVARLVSVVPSEVTA